jgi:hypothetical protein
MDFTTEDKELIIDRQATSKTIVYIKYTYVYDQVKKDVSIKKKEVVELVPTLMIDAETKMCTEAAVLHRYHFVFCHPLQISVVI